MRASSILVFDSGLGGLTVYREVAAARPDAHFIYVGDDAGFPYGLLTESELVDRVLALMAELIDRHRPDLIVIACNTASTLVLPQLRSRFPLRFVGTVPAIKPACAASLSKRISVLGTEATVNREYTKALIRQFANGSEVRLVGSARLAGFAEAELHGDPAPDHAIVAEIAPCFVEDGGARTDTVVLACTHYPLLLERLRALAPWPVTFIDPAPAIARRVVELIGPSAGGPAPAPPQLHFTSGRAPSPTLAAALARFGLTPTARESFASTRTSRVIKAPREALYQAFLDPAALAAWLPPGEMTGKIHSFDAKVGGAYRMSLFYPASEQVHRGKTSEREDSFTARFIELAPPARIVQAVSFHSADPAFAEEMILEATFEPVDGGTEVTILCKHIPPGIRPEDNEAGCRSSLEQLARYAE
jgi:glutamate racemase